MNESLHILGIAGSLRQGSYNRMALKAATELLPKHTTLEIFDLEGIPLYNQELENPMPKRVGELKAALKKADAVLIVTPEYNYSIPGVLKNAIDWASRPYGDNSWFGKPAAIMGASVGKLGTARAQYHLRQTFVFLNVYAVNQPEVMIGGASEQFDAEGKLNNDMSKKLIRQLLESLVTLTRQLQSEKVHTVS